ncbi:Uma2 family endonuclease [Actinoallomurus oryzae]|uniref:Uma2 family endonuclease n=1 Tax=Actinoallomurus oryzae TaxID=502180 RepID=A0ABP8R0D4_9ACTN
MTEVLAMPQDVHSEPWTIDDVLAAPPKNGMRYELIEGRLVVSPVPPPPHQAAGKRLIRILDSAAPRELEASPETNLRVGADMFIPDVMVAKSEALFASGSMYVAPEDVLMVVEIISPGNSTFERAWKPQQYAKGGIPFYMEIELPAGPRVLASELRDGKYERVAEARAGETLKLAEPFPVSFDPGDLVGPRRSAG